MLGDESLPADVPTFAGERAAAEASLRSPEVRALYTTLGVEPDLVDARIERLPARADALGWSAPPDWWRHMASATPLLSPELRLWIFLCGHGSAALKEALAPSPVSIGDLLFLAAHKAPETVLQAAWPGSGELTGRVVVLNDPFTPMEFVVLAIEGAFGIGRERTVTQMLEIHHTGSSAFNVPAPGPVIETCLRLNREWRAQGVAMYCVPEASSSASDT